MILIICQKARQGRIEVGKDFNHDGNENCDTPVKKAEFICWKLVGHDILSIEDSSEEGEDKGNCDNDSNCGDYTKYSPHRLGEVRYPPVCYEGPSLWFCFVAFELESLISKTLFFKIFNHYGPVLFTVFGKGPLLGEHTVHISNSLHS